ncbi:MAG: hypothetical protein QM689_08410 [Oscillospiraceae bacterium]
MNTFEKARKFIYRNARPLDLARWEFYFENGDANDVLTALSSYQNHDGGFGHGLEPDCFNPNSSPIQTWAATEILRQIGFTDCSHPVIQGILRYLGSGADFDKAHNQWRNAVATNNDFPHAIWWEFKDGEDEFTYNPTACLAGFALCYADKASALYKKAREIAVQAYGAFAAKVPFDEAHITACYIRLFDYCARAGITELFDMELFRVQLIEQVTHTICADTEKWGKEYVTLPSRLIDSPKSIFYAGNEELAAAECDFLMQNQLADGSYTVPWQWWTDYKEFELAANWWKSDIIVNNMRFLQGFGKV